MTARILLIAPFMLLGLAAQASETETPAQLDPVELTAEQRLEGAFREVQVGLERVRSDRDEDAEKIVCVKQKPTGSNIPVINCATNRYWNVMRNASLSSFNSVAGSGGSGRPGDKVFTMSLTDFNKLQKRYGKMPEELKQRI